MLNTNKVTRRAFRLAYAQRILSFATTFISTVILAHLLSPTQFGYAAIATIAINFLVVFRDFGLTSTTIQREILTIDERDALFWMNAAIVTIITLLALAVSPLVGKIYHEPTVSSLMLLAAVGFFISGVASQHAAVLRRNMEFGIIFIAEFGGMFLGTLTAILFAYYIRNAYALVLGSLVQSVFTALGVAFLGGWFPKIHRNLMQQVHLIRFGGDVAMFTALNYATNNLASVIIGIFNSSADVGFYNRAQTLFELPRSFILGPYLQVQFIMLCKDAVDPPKSRKRYMEILTVTGFLFIPAALVLPVVSHDVVVMFLGQRWERSSSILAYLSPAVAALGIVGPFAQYLTSLGKVSQLRNWGFFDFLIRGGGAAFGSHFGPEGAAAGFSMATLLIGCPIIMLICSTYTLVSFSDQVRASFPGILSGLAAMFCAVTANFLAVKKLGLSNPWVTIFVILSAFVGWLLVLMFHSRSREILLVSFKRA